MSAVRLTLNGPNTKYFILQPQDCVLIFQRWGNIEWKLVECASTRLAAPQWMLCRHDGSWPVRTPPPRPPQPSTRIPITCR